MDLGLKDKLIIVTGGGAGIGAAITRACLSEGARVVILSRGSKNVMDFMAEMNASKANCILIEINLEDITVCKDAIRDIEESFGGIDALVNNAGVNDGVGLESGSVERFIQSLGKNLTHYY